MIHMTVDSFYIIEKKNAVVVSGNAGLNSGEDISKKHYHAIVKIKIDDLYEKIDIHKFYMEEFVKPSTIDDDGQYKSLNGFLLYFPDSFEVNGVDFSNCIVEFHPI